MPTSLGPAEIMVILVVALIVLGPKRLPEAGRQVGKALAEVRKWSQGFQNEIRSAIEPDTARPSYSQPQPGYDPPPIPMVPAETAPPPDEGSMSPPGPTNGTAPPAETNGTATTTAGSHAEVDTSSPADWTPWDRPTPAPPPEPPGAAAGEPPAT